MHHLVLSTIFTEKAAMQDIFEDRRQAGLALAEKLMKYRDTPELLVLALPRGGVPVAYEVARALDADLDVLTVRKLGVPQQPELAMGAIASGGAQTLNDSVIQSCRVTEDALEQVLARERRELERREKSYRGDLPAPRIKGRTVIIVDDGLATGASMEAAIKALRSLEPARVIIAVPVAPPDSINQLVKFADDVVCILTPQQFYALSLWYHDFSQTTDEEVHDLLDKARQLLLNRA